MRYLKCTLAGLVAVIAVAVISPFIMLPIASYLHRDQLHEGEAIGWDPVRLLRTSWVPWVILLIAFAFGFYLQFRRIRDSREPR